MERAVGHGLQAAPWEQQGADSEERAGLARHVAVSFSRHDIDDPEADPDDGARSHGQRLRDPIEAGPVGG